MKRSILAALSTTPKFKIGKISRKTKQKMEFQVDKVGGSHPTDLKHSISATIWNIKKPLWHKIHTRCFFSA